MKSYVINSAVLVVLAVTADDGVNRRSAENQNLINNGSLEGTADGDRSPPGFELSGDVAFGVLGDERDCVGKGVRLFASKDVNGDGQHSGLVTTAVRSLSPEAGRWFRLRLHGLAQDNFAVAEDGLYLEIEDVAGLCPRGKSDLRSDHHQQRAGSQPSDNPSEQGQEREQSLEYDQGSTRG